MASNKKARIIAANGVATQSKQDSSWSMSDVYNAQRLDIQSISDFVGDMLGTGTTVQTTNSRNLDLAEGPNHSTTGIPYSIHGTATVVQQTVAHALASYQDPIKLIMPTAVHRSRRIVIRRKYVVGGQTIITPERAPARTVAIREDEREVMLTRYGGDLEMNLNLFLRPADAKAEFDMKLSAQMRQLEQQLVKLGYEQLLDAGTNLVAALEKVNLRGNVNGAPTMAAHMTYVKTLFGCMQKNRYPLQNMMGAAKMAGLHMPAANGGYNTCILPTGLLEMERVTKPETMEYYLTGTSEANRKQIALGLDNVYQDPRVPGMKIMVHHPFPNFDQGSAYPVGDPSCLSREFDIHVMYSYTCRADNSLFRIPNHYTGGWTEIPANDGRSFVYYQKLTVRAASAIFAINGANTGELLYAYPSTGISTSQTTEAMKMQLRVYMGAVCYDPTRILIVPDVHIENVSATEGPNVIFGPAVVGGVTADDVPAIDDYDTRGNPITPPEARQMLTSEYLTGTLAGETVILHQGHVQQLTTDRGWQTVRENTGHLGMCDNPNDPRLSGQFKFVDRA